MKITIILNDWHLNGLTTAWEETGVAGETPCQVNHLDDHEFDYYCDDFYDDFYDDCDDNYDCDVGAQNQIDVLVFIFIHIDNRISIIVIIIVIIIMSSLNLVDYPMFSLLLST